MENNNYLMKQENTLLIAVLLILLAMIAIIIVPLILLNPNGAFNQYTFFVILFVGFLFIIFLAVFLAIKQKRNIWG